MEVPISVIATLTDSGLDFAMEKHNPWSTTHYDGILVRAVDGTDGLLARLKVFLESTEIGRARGMHAVNAMIPQARAYVVEKKAEWRL